MNADILVIGGGHAGIEAASIASQLGHNIILVSAEEVSLGSTPCNPAIGGVGKGQVVREIDALGGVMGYLADQSAIQFRTLNESKGYAVQSTRAQVDKNEYSKNAEKLLNELKRLQIIRAKVLGVKKINTLFHVELSDKRVLISKKIIVTTGTFLAGKLHCGADVKGGGRVDCQSSEGLLDIFKEISTVPQRFKTGTPARLDKDTINYEKMIKQTSDNESHSFSYKFDRKYRKLPQVDCFITHTNAETLKVIRDNKEKSPIFNGQITAIGPRYCPSIEDKAFRYLDRDVHHVFIEPEGHDLQTVYPNGLSTSLPKDIQLDFLRTINGLEDVEVLVPGYAVEYDVVDTSKLSIGLEYIDIPGLYFAGQVNGTSGYEEAAGQGLVAGINAVFSLQDRGLFKINRYESYIGVMIEDLISSRRDEPYRLFTARSENRLFIREDNTVNRMAKYRKLLKLELNIDRYQDDYLRECEILENLVDKHTIIASVENKKRFTDLGYGNLPANIWLSELVKRPNIDPVQVIEEELRFLGASFRQECMRTIAISKKYEGYVNRSDQENRKVRVYDQKEINWQNIVSSRNISFECKTRIEEIRPKTFSELKKIEGIRPATLVYVAGNLIG